MTPEEILFFDKLADAWDENEVLSTPGKVSEMLSIMDIDNGMDVLDLGTGTGVLLPELSRLCGSSGSVTAIDISEGMLNKAMEKFGSLQNVEIKKLDFEKNDIRGKYDLIILYCVYPHLHTPRETLSKLAGSNLKPEGRIVIAFPSDEKFINNIHKERKAESDFLPAAAELVSRINGWGLKAEVLRYDASHYVISISR